MARPWRIQFEDAVYHLTARGNRKQDIFLNDPDRLHFMALLARAVRRFELRVFAFCLMSNHYHLFLQTPLANLSSAMQWLNGSYTSYFNWQHKTIGHLFHGRYKAVLVVEEAHWLHLSMYIHLNPVRAQMVANPAAYQWSSFPDYIAAKPRDQWLCRDDILSDYGTAANRLKRYQKECLEMIGAKPPFVEQLKNGIILGPKEMIKALAKKFRPAGKVDSVTKYTLAARREINAEQELEKLARVFGVKIQELERRHWNFPARLAAYYHLVENCGMKTTETAEVLKVSPNAVSIGIRRFEKLLNKDRKLQIKIKSLCSL